jgi:hypothetical protein
MTTLFGNNHDVIAAAQDADAGGDEASIREALRVTMLFVAVVLLLVWAGIANAGQFPNSATRVGVPGGAPGSSPTLR